MTDVNQIFAKGGAMEALLEMREQKVVSNLGVHWPLSPRCVDGVNHHRYPFDTILMALNARSPQFSFRDQLLPLAVEKQMGIIGMKVPARGRILSTWTPPPARRAEAHVGRDGAGSDAGHDHHA